MSKMYFEGERAEYYGLNESSKAHWDGLNLKCVAQTHACNTCFSAVGDILEVFGVFGSGTEDLISGKRSLLS